MTQTMTSEMMSSRIGTLCRNGETVYYTYLAGELYVEDTDWTTLQFYITCEERDGATYRAGRAEG